MYFISKELSRNFSFYPFISTLQPMREIALQELCEDSSVQRVITQPISYVDPHRPIRGLAYDSRKVNPGYLFFALSGLHVDGHDFIDQAIDSGAVAIVLEREVPKRPGVTYIFVEHSRQAMAPFAAAFWRHPERRISLVGVTGTDGKSTTASFIYQLLKRLGHRVGLISTVEIDLGHGLIINPMHQSTPEAPELYGMLHTMAEGSLEYGIIETTSHGLSEQYNRLGGLIFQGAVFTNITHEHMEFHKTMENYLSAKLNLINKISSSGWAIRGEEFPYPKEFDEALGHKDLWTIALSQSIEHQRNSGGSLGVSYESRRSGYDVQFLLKKQEEQDSWSAYIPLLGEFNIENSMMASIAVANLLAIPLRSITELLPSLKTPKGRMNLINEGQPFRAVIDFAHTPGSYKRLLPMMREITEKRLIILFGSAGERDIEKRELLGQEANKWADVVILTNEDPRGENELDIVNEIAGVIKKPKVLKILNREDAITEACKIAEEGDTCLLLGKGHEKSIIYLNREVPWDEEEVLRKTLRIQQGKI